MDKIASCRFVYLVRAEGDEQLDSTCLFVWRIPLWQRLQEGLSERFQRWRFAAVGRSWSKDFRVNWKIHSGSAQVAFDHSCMSLFDITPSIELEIIPCEIRDSTCDFDLCCSCNLCSFSDSSRVLFAIRLSISICLWWVACQICCISWLMLFLRLNRFDRNNLECMNVKDWMPRPQECFGSDLNSSMQAQIGSFSQSLMCLFAIESSSASIQVLLKLYVLSEHAPQRLIPQRLYVLSEHLHNWWTATVPAADKGCCMTVII